MAKKDKHLAVNPARRLVVRGVNGVYTMLGWTKDPDPPIEADLTRGDGSGSKAMRTKMTEHMVLYEELNLPPTES